MITLPATGLTFLRCNNDILLYKINNQYSLLMDINIMSYCFPHALVDEEYIFTIWFKITLDKCNIGITNFATDQDYPFCGTIFF